MVILSLEKLIYSLNKGELKAVSLAMKKKNNSKYKELFHVIRNKKEVKQKLQPKELQQRKYLYDLILETLSKQVKSAKSKILRHIFYTETLFERQFIKEAWKEINKAQKIAEHFEYFGFLIQILDWKRKIGFFIETFVLNDSILISKYEKPKEYQMIIVNDRK